MKKSHSNNSPFEKKNILGTWFDNVNYHDVLEYSLKIIKNGAKKHYFVTPNPEIIMLARGNARYEKAINDADLALADGAGVLWAGKMLGKSLKARIPGADLLENLCRDVAKRPITVGFLGGGPGVAELTADCLLKKYPELKIGMVLKELTLGNSKTRRTHFEDSEKIRQAHLKDDANQGLKKVDILFVAFGSPKQELWISENLKNLPAKITIGVGGAFDFISGKVPRAPRLVRKLGFEWLFRLIIQPWRIKRQLSLVRFTILTLRVAVFGI